MCIRDSWLPLPLAALGHRGWGRPWGDRGGRVSLAPHPVGPRVHWRQPGPSGASPHMGPRSRVGPLSQ
eukprot:4197319-Alexandrium_andersonii.AAC.1